MNNKSKTNTKAKVRKRIRRKVNQKTRKKVRRIIRNYRARTMVGRVAAAYAKNFAKVFKIVRQDGNSMTVKGRDLVYAIPDTLISTIQDTNVITVIPCNPCYWLGTRISAIANGYQNYRPTKFNVSYVPQCAVTQQGNVICGTLWNQSPSAENLQQTLRTSSGGCLTQCYKPAKSIVSMRSNLQFNLFRCAGKFDQESNPFNFIAIAVGCTDSNNNKIVPGYFYVDWEYSFKNPIGYTNLFYNSGIKRVKDLDLNIANCTLVSCEYNKDLGVNVGMIIQVDKGQDDKLLFTYNNTKINMDSDSDLIVWAFNNKSISIQQQPEPEPTEYYELYYTSKGVNQTGNVVVTNTTLVYYLDAEDPNKIWMFLNVTGQGQERTVPPGTLVYEFRNYYAGSNPDDFPMIFGELHTSSVSNMLKFMLKKEDADEFQFTEAT